MGGGFPRSFMFHCNGAAATTYDGSIVVHELLAITLRVVAIQAKQ